MMDKIKLAILFATKKHHGQMRKFGGGEFISHPLGVLEIAKLYTRDEDVLTACILHDTVEDTKTTKKELETYFGANVARLVATVTHENQSSWIHTRLKYLEQLETGPKSACIVAIADKIHNTKSLIEAIESGKNMEKMRNYRDIQWFNFSVAVISGNKYKKNQGIIDMEIELLRVTKEFVKTCKKFSM